MNDGKLKYIILSSVITAFVSWAIPKLCDLFIPALQNNIFVLHPTETVILAVLASIFGFLIGWKAREGFRFSSTKQDKNQAKENFEKVKDSLMQQSSSLKALMKASVEKGTVYCDEEDWKYSRIPEEPFFSQFLQTSYIDGNRAKITPKQPLIDIDNMSPEIFSGLSKTIEEHGIERNMNHHYRFSTDTIPFWWWYR